MYRCIRCYEGKCNSEPHFQEAWRSRHWVQPRKGFKDLWLERVLTVYERKRIGVEEQITPKKYRRKNSTETP